MRQYLSSTRVVPAVIPRRGASAVGVVLAVCQLVSTYLAQLDANGEGEEAYSPTVRRLIGILPNNTTVEQYHPPHQRIPQARSPSTTPCRIRTYLRASTRRS